MRRNATGFGRIRLIVVSGMTGRRPDMVEENRRLREENLELRRINEILKAASAFFAAEHDRTRRRS
jgi:transposase-like protein